MSKLSEILQTLSAAEAARLSQYLNSGYFTNNQNLFHLYTFYLNGDPPFSDPKPQSLPFSRNRYNYLKHLLYQQTLDFLVLERQNAQYFEKEMARINLLRERGLNKTAAGFLERLQEFQSDQKEVNNDIYRQNLDLASVHMEFAIASGSHNPQLALEQMFNALDQHHLLLELKYLLPARMLQRLYRIEFPRERFEGAMKAATQSSDLLIQIFYHLLALIDRRNDQLHWQELNDLLEKAQSRISSSERLNIYGYLQNHLTQRAQEGHSEALGQLFSVYQKMDAHNLLLVSHNQIGDLLRNVVITGCRLGALEWTDAFLSRNMEQIKTYQDGNAYAYCRAYLSFYQKDFSESLRQLQEIDLQNPLYRTSHQILLLRIYYELNEFQLLDGLLSTFRRFLNRAGSISENRKNLNRNFLSILHQLSRIKETGLTKNRLHRVRELLDSNQPITDRTWLTEKYIELEVHIK